MLDISLFIDMLSVTLILYCLRNYHFVLQYVLRDSSKAGNGKDKSYILVPKRDDQQLSDKSRTSAPGSGIDLVEGEIGMSYFFLS